MEGRRLIALDGLRGIAALCVLGFHAVNLIGGRNIFVQGWLAVDFFFLLSGFVIARTYEEKLLNGLKPTAYLWIRYRRFFPAILCGTLLGFMVTSLFQYNISVYMYSLLNVLILPVYTTSLLFPINGPQWSLLAEYTINAAHAYAIRFLKTEVLCIIVLISATCLVMIYLTGGDLNGGSEWHSVGVGIVRVCFAFPFGVLMFRHESVILNLTPQVSVLVPIMLLSINLITPISADLIKTHALICILIGWPLLFTISIKSTVPIYMRYTLDRLGWISYPLYATHEPILNVLSKFMWMPGQLGLLRPAMGLAAVIAALGVAYVTAIIGDWMLQSKASGDSKLSLLR